MYEDTDTVSALPPTDYANKATLQPGIQSGLSGSRSIRTCESGTVLEEFWYWFKTEWRSVERVVSPL